MKQRVTPDVVGKGDLRQTQIGILGRGDPKPVKTIGFRSKMRT